MRSYACSCLDAGGCDLLGVSAIPFSVGGNLLGVAGRYWFAFVQHDPLLLPLLRLDCEVEALSRWSAMRFVVNFPGIEESAHGIVSRVTPVHTALRNCTRDEGRPFEVGNQVLISSHRKLLSSKAMVVNFAEKSEQDFGRND